MEQIFIKVINLSYQTAFVIGILLLVRLIFGLLHVPKKFCCLLWYIPFFRLLCPISIESVWSLLPKQEPLVAADIGYMAQPVVHTSLPAADVIISQSLPAAQPANSINPMQTVMAVFSFIWLAGVCVFLFYNFISWLWLKKKLRVSMHLKENIYLADYAEVPFILGVFKPRIYLPSDTTDRAAAQVLPHEQMHIKRYDPLCKCLAFLGVALHWFNPLVWCAYVMLGRDMEMACDEAVLSRAEAGISREYADVLLRYASGRRPGGVPLAFSEGNPGSRIQNVLHYKKPLVGVSVAVGVLLIALAAGLLLNPVVEPAAEEGPTPNTVNQLPEAPDIGEAGEATAVVPQASDVKDMRADISGNVYNLEKTEWCVLAVSTERAFFFLNTDEEIWLEGPYSVEEDIFILTDEAGNQYRFRIEKNGLVFLQEGSAAFPTMESQGQSVHIEDGDRLRFFATLDTKTLHVPAPQLSADMPVGEEYVFIDYADSRLVIFHGYFGLFVYDKSERLIVGAVDLQDIFYDPEQGYAPYQVSVTADGSAVYLESEQLMPFANSLLYVYDVEARSLTLENADFCKEALFDDIVFLRAGDFIDEYLGWRSYRRVTLRMDEGNVIYGYLESIDETINNLQYVEGDQVYPLFAQYFGESSGGAVIDANAGFSAYAITIREITADGAVLEIFNNTEDSEITFGADFTLYRWDENWELVELPIAESGWAYNLVGYFLKGGGSLERTVYWEAKYGSLPEGEYYLMIEIEIQGEDGITKSPLGVGFAID